MTEPRLAGVKPFTIAGVTFECWVVKDGDFGGNFEWRSTCRRVAAWRDVRIYRGAVDGKQLAGEFASLRIAMQAAAGAANRRATA